LNSDALDYLFAKNDIFKRLNLADFVAGLRIITDLVWYKRLMVQKNIKYCIRLGLKFIN